MNKLVNKSWGCEIWWADTELYMGKTLIINPNCSTSLHYHEHKDETITVQRGRLIISWEPSLSEPPSELMPDDVVHLVPQQAHKLTAGPQGVTLVEVSTPHPDDSVRVGI